MSRIASVTNSKHVSVDYDTVAYRWTYKMFTDLALYVDFCNDRQQAYDSGENHERKLESKNKQR